MLCARIFPAQRRNSWWITQHQLATDAMLHESRISRLPGAIASGDYIHSVGESQTRMENITMNRTPITDLHTEELLTLLVARDLRPTQHALVLSQDDGFFNGSISAKNPADAIESQAGTLKEVLQDLLAKAREEPVVRSCMDFGGALRCLKEGRHVARKAWLHGDAKSPFISLDGNLIVNDDLHHQWKPMVDAIMAEDWILL